MLLLFWSAADPYRGGMHSVTERCPQQISQWDSNFVYNDNIPRDAVSHVPREVKQFRRNSPAFAPLFLMAEFPVTQSSSNF